MLLIVLVRRNKRKNNYSYDEYNYDSDDNKKDYSDTALLTENEDTEMLDSRYGNSGEFTFQLGIAEEHYITLSSLGVDPWSQRVGIKDHIIVGRDSELCDCVIDFDRSVSSRHCEISLRDGHYYLNDLGSTNGTYVNDTSIKGECEIVSGTVLRLGRGSYIFETE